MIPRGEVMSEDTKDQISDDENLGDESLCPNNEWYLQSQLDSRFNISLAREQIRKDKEFGKSYYGGML